jgi:phosphoribosyl 1,2-cyclic phosphate phosphodiesterase
MKSGSLIFLGTGSSSGIPIIGCHCHVCNSSDARNKRLRSAALLTYQGRKFLIDAGPDIRQQLLKHEVWHVDGLILTHSHYDHIGGLDDLRSLCIKQNAPLPCLASKYSYGALQQLFYYIFKNPNGKRSSTAQFQFSLLPSERGCIDFCGVPISYFHYTQGTMPVTGFRVGTLAYVTDIKEYPKTIFEDLQGVKTLILSALRFTKSSIQFSVDEAVDFANTVRAEKTFLIHLSHELDHAHLSNLLPASISLAYDGLEIDLSQ